MIGIDGGARYGVHRSLDILRYFGEVHLFEPDIDEYNRLAQKYISSPNIIVNPYGLSSQNSKSQLNIVEHAALSTFLPVPANKFKGTSREAQYNELNKSEVSLVRLDSVCKISPSFIKLDIEGMELDALIGLGSLISDVAGIRCECQLRQVFEDNKAALFFEVDNWLINQGFDLISIDDTSIGRRTSIFSVDNDDGVLTSIDAVWINKKQLTSFSADSVFDLNHIYPILWLFMNNMGSEALTILKGKLEICPQFTIDIIDDAKIRSCLKYFFLLHALMIGSQDSPARQSFEDLYYMFFKNTIPSFHLLRYELSALADVN